MPGAHRQPEQELGLRSDHPLRVAVLGIPAAAGTMLAEEMLVGKCGIAARLGSVATAAQSNLAGILGLVDASFAESATSGFPARVRAVSLPASERSPHRSWS